MSDEVEATRQAVLATVAGGEFVQELAEDLGKSAIDSLTRKATKWVGDGAKKLWGSGCERVHQSGRTPKAPRVQAAIEITKHGAIEERPDLRVAYENLAARSMTEDEWEHDYEEYAQRLSKLQPGDIALLRSIHEKTRPTPEQRQEGHLVFMKMLDLIGPDGDDLTNVMGAVDRLEANGLLIVRVDGPQTQGGERQPDNWIVPENMGIHLGYFSVLPNPRGVALLKHISDLEPIDQTVEACSNGSRRNTQ